MKKILIQCAMEKEAKQLTEKLNLIEKTTHYACIEKMYEKENITLVVTGIGKQKTAIGLTCFLENEFKPDLIINIGFAGSTKTPVGTWVSINKSYNLDWHIEEENYSMKDVGNQDLVQIEGLESLKCYSADSFVTKSEFEENVIFDMELHSVCIIADIYKIPLISLKKVTDNLSLENYYENIQSIIELGSSLKYLKKVIEG